LPSPEKQRLTESGKDLVESFCEFNGLRTPRFDVREPKDWRVSACGYYRPETIFLCPTRCAAIGVSGMAWSYPGYIIDRTPHGVMAHELGHHVDYVRSEDKGSYGGDFSERMRAASGEPKLTNYCPNDWEWFAEMFRLFVTNPLLLEAVRPRTFSLLIASGLKPVGNKPWREVLKDAPLRTQLQAEKKAGLCA
jgi:hypothetical protein